MTTNLAKNTYYPYVQKFFKKLRKFGLKFRYYCCAEYGSDFGRLHFHVILFSLSLNQKYRPYLVNTSPKKKRRKPRLQTYFEAELSTLLSDKYKIGFVEKVQECNAEAARYVTKYVCKCQADEEHDKCPFHRQSLGLGTQWLYKNKELIGREEIEPIMPNNQRGDFTYFCPIPKYYRTKFIKAYGNYLQRCINLVNTNDDTYRSQLHSEPVRYPDLFNFKLDSDYGIYKGDINARFRQQTTPLCYSGMDTPPVRDEFSDDRLDGLSLDFSENPLPVNSEWPDLTILFPNGAYVLLTIHENCDIRQKYQICKYIQAIFNLRYGIMTELNRIYHKSKQVVSLLS
ncbi:unnamed protein product [Cylicocyclus nassatus]|uniref:Replication-associated protein ORF2/G2P domain-containing protein n=1 Tax=Cylicocyclus nassatus TaxID=53992 RepID=A0AA36GKH0_CYLNA|nr:unnamed protein product [Cylicocyclus nassatus]